MSDAFSTSDHATIQDHPNNQGSPPIGSGADNGHVQQENWRIQRDQKASFLDHLIRNIDIVIYCQLSVLYYMDCSLIKFLFRALPYWFYLTPKPAIFPPTPLAHRPYIGIIFGTNISCMLLHLVFSPPVAGEVTRGYLHGGLVIDFIGQASPVGSWRLIGLDALVLALQILALRITLERRGTKTFDEIVRGYVQAVTENRQDHDSEERGILRQDANGINDFELHDLRNVISGRSIDDEDRGQDELSLGHGQSEPHDHHPLDPFYTGDNIIANIHILDTIHTQWQASRLSAERSDAAAVAAPVPGVQAAAVAAGRTITYRLGQGMRRNG